MHDDKVAFIISVYEKETPDFFRLSLESMLLQDKKVDIFLYVDGSLTLELERVLSSFENKENIFIFRSNTLKSKGLSYGLNYLIEQVILCDYTFIARMDSDDVSYPSRISKQVEFLLVNQDIDVLGTSCHEFGASYALTEKHLPQSHEELLNFSISRCPLIHPSVMFRATVFKSGIRYPTNTVLTEDMALWFELLYKGFRFSNLNEVLLDYRLNEDTIERRKGLSKAISEIRIRTANMFLLKQFSFKNVILIYSRLAFHLMPSSLVKLAYKKAR